MTADRLAPTRPIGQSGAVSVSGQERTKDRVWVGNHTLWFVVVVAVAVSGCSGGHRGVSHLVIRHPAYVVATALNPSSTQNPDHLDGTADFQSGAFSIGTRRFGFGFGGGIYTLYGFFRHSCQNPTDVSRDAPPILAPQLPSGYRATQRALPDGVTRLTIERNAI